MKDFEDMFPVEAIDADDELDPSSRYYVAASARSAPELFGAGENGPDSRSLFASAPLSFQHLNKLFERMPRVLQALRQELESVETEDDAGATIKLYPRKAGEAAAAYSARLMTDAWPDIWERTARAAYETSKGFDRAARNCRVSGKGPFRWDVRRLAYEPKEGHVRQVHRLTHGQAMIRLHNLYNHVIRRLPKELRYTLIPMSRPRNGFDPLDTAGKYGYAELPLEDFLKPQLVDENWRLVPYQAAGTKRTFVFAWAGPAPVPRLPPNAGAAPGRRVQAEQVQGGGLQAGLAALYAPLGGGAVNAASALRLRQLLNKGSVGPADVPGEVRFWPTESRRLRGGARFELGAGGEWDVRLPGGALLMAQRKDLLQDLASSQALYARILAKINAGVASGALSAARLAALQTLGPHWQSGNAFDQSLRGVFLSYNVVLVSREELIRLVYAPANAAKKKAMREQLLDACRSYEELASHRAWTAAGKPMATPKHQRGFNRMMKAGDAANFFKPSQRMYYEVSQVALLLPPAGDPVICGFCTLDKFTVKERKLDVAGPGPAGSVVAQRPYFDAGVTAALTQTAVAAGETLPAMLCEYAVEVNMVGFNHEPIVGTVLGRGMGMLLLLHTLLQVAGKNFSLVTLFPIWGAPADEEGFSDMDRLRSAQNATVPRGQVPDVPVMTAYHEILGAQRCFAMSDHLSNAQKASAAAARKGYVDQLRPDLHGTANAARIARLEQALESMEVLQPPPWCMHYDALPAFPANGALSQPQAAALLRALVPYARTGNFVPSTEDMRFAGMNISGMKLNTPAARAKVQAWGTELRSLLANPARLDTRLHEYRMARGFPQPEDMLGSLLLLRMQNPELFNVAAARAAPLMGGETELQGGALREESDSDSNSDSESDQELYGGSAWEMLRSTFIIDNPTAPPALPTAEDMFGVPGQLASKEDMLQAAKYESSLEGRLPASTLLRSLTMPYPELERAEARTSRELVVQADENRQELYDIAARMLQGGEDSRTQISSLTSLEALVSDS